eukprot:PITA_20776
MNKRDVNAHIIRSFLLLQQFDLTIIDKPGKGNIVADFLSRVNLPVVFPPHLSSKEKSKIVRKSAPFTWIGGNLFKHDLDQILRGCVREEEVFDILLTCHDGPSGGHFVVKRIAFKILQAGYYWPTLHQATVEEKVAKFFRDNIFYKFEYPRELVIDQGSQFTSNLIEDLFTHHRIKHRTSTHYHTQANGKVEVTNRALEGILTKVVSSNRKYWVDRLVEDTWAYKTTWKTTTGFTPFELVYGKKALLSIEFEFNTLRMAAQLDLDLSHAQKEILLQFNGLDEHRMQGLLHIEVVELQRKIWHDKNIKEKQFQERYWALLYDS